MHWLTELSLVLIIGSWTVFAATGENTEKDVKFLIKPWNIFNEKNPTSKPATIIIRPEYPQHQYPLNSYPSHYYPNYKPNRRPHKPKPSQNYHHYYPTPDRPPYGYYPIYNSAPPHYSPDTDRNKQNQPPVLLVYGPEYAQYGPQHGSGYWNDEKFDNADRLFVKSFSYPSAENVKAIEPLEDNETEFPEQENEQETDGSKAELSGISLINDSEEDSDSVIIDSDHIKLPFGIQLASHNAPALSKSGKKFKQQEALIYLKNFKKGRKVEQV